jgi:hemolysin D
LRSTIETRERLVALLNQRLSMKRELLATGSGSLTGVLDAQQQVEQELTNLAYDKGQLLESQAAAESSESKINQLLHQFVADQSGKLSDAERKRDHLAQDLVKAAHKAERVKLIAPINGTVQQLAVSTIGQVVTTGQSLLVIVPDTGPLEIEALVPNSDIGFLEVGQDAVIKIDAFPFSRYGTVDGRVVRVSRDAVFDKDVSNMDAATAPQQNASVLSSTPKMQGLVYPVTVEFSRRSIRIDNKDVLLSAGMTGAIEIRTGDRRVIDYLLSPLREMVSQAGHER